MNFTIKTLTVGALIVFNMVNAQDTELLDQRINKYLTKEKTETSKFNQVVSLDLKFNVYTEFLSSSFNKKNYFINNITGDTVSKNAFNLAFTIVSFGFEPRFNLYQNDKNAFGIKLTSHINISAIENAISPGFMHVSQGLYGFFGRGFSGAYNNVNERGFALSAGLLTLFAPVFWDKNKRDSFYSNYTALPGSENFGKRLFLVPALQIDYYKNNPNRKRQRVTSITTGYNLNSYFFRFNFGISI